MIGSARAAHSAATGTAKTSVSLSARRRSVSNTAVSRVAACTASDGARMAAAFASTSVIGTFRSRKAYVSAASAPGPSLAAIARSIPRFT